MELKIKMKEHCQNGLKNLVKSIFLLGALVFATPAYSQEGAPAAPAGLTEVQKAGEAIFEAECRTCHNFGSDATGPKLGGVVKRQGKEWLKVWVDNPAKVIASGDKHANDMKTKYGSVMPTLGLESEDIDAVISYLEVGKDAEVVVDGGDQVTPGQKPVVDNS